MALQNLLTNFNTNDTSSNPRRIAKMRVLFLAKKANSANFKNNGVSKTERKAVAGQFLQDHMI